MPRHLSEQFISDLKAGPMNWLLCRVQNDLTLSLDIRPGDAINVYYRGASALQVTRKGKKYIAKTARGFFRGSSSLVSIPTDATDDAGWEHALPTVKDAIDRYQATTVSAHEREFQQLLLRENSRQPGMSKSTDYFACDIEYVHQFDNFHARFDLVGAYWPSNGSIRKNGGGLPLVVIEMKYADQALSGASGIQSHVQHFAEFFSDDMHANSLAAEMTVLANQKRELELIKGCSRDFQIDVNGCQVGLLFANHDPESGVLLRELDALDERLLEAIPNGLKFFCPTGGGYGLFHDQVYDLETFRQLLASREGIAKYRNRRFRSGSK